ncbi:NAD-dependent epimerase/dehydratase family protein [Thermodesulfobacteriota bacterium]
MNILVTGGAGFIGSHTTDALIENGHYVRILDNLQKTIHPKGKPKYLNPQADFILGDVREKRAWEKALKGMDAVFHFAAYQDYLPDFSTFFHVNAVSTALLYEILVEKGLAAKFIKVIVAASQAVMGEGRYRCRDCFTKNQQYVYPQIRLEKQLSMGEWDHRCPQCHRILEWMPSDESVFNPCNQYALSKYSQEQIALQLGKRYSIPTVVMRYSIVQGPRQSFYNAYSGAMRIFALSLMFDRQPTIFEDGNQIRDFVNIKDVVDANLLVLEHSEANDEVFNVGGDSACTVNEFYNTMQAVVDRKKEPIMSGYYRFGDTRHIFSDIAKLKSLGWVPARSVKDSMEDYWEYITSQEDMDNILEYSEKQMKHLQVIRKIKKDP